MATKTVSCIISQELVATRPDVLGSDCLRVECGGRVILPPNGQTKMNLSVHNSSSEGRMAQIMANFDPRQVAVAIPNSYIFVPGNGKTTIFAIISAISNTGQATITFDAH